MITYTRGEAEENGKKRGISGEFRSGFG